MPGPPRSGRPQERVAAAAREAGTPFLSHDDSSPETRQRFRALGSRVSEFPQNLATAREAARAGEDVVMGAPNVLRGRSHMGWLSAEEAVAERVCTILASDYYYPALLPAPYLLAARGVMGSAKPGSWSRPTRRGRPASPTVAASLPVPVPTSSWSRTAMACRRGSSRPSSVEEGRSSSTRRAEERPCEPRGHGPHLAP